MRSMEKQNKELLENMKQSEEKLDGVSQDITIEMTERMTVNLDDKKKKKVQRATVRVMGYIKEKEDQDKMKETQ